MSRLGYLGVAYALAWLAIVGYLVSLARRQASLERRIEHMRSQQEERLVEKAPAAGAGRERSTKKSPRL
ncbi:MAG: CcmD family protein [Actinomycetota bacterium]